MINYQNTLDNYDYNNLDYCEMINGDSIDVSLKKDDCELRADLVVSKFKSVRIWGQIRDCDGIPISNALVKLIKIVRNCGKIQYQGLSHTTTDCNGFYQFDVDPCIKEGNYKILVSKCSVGRERVIPHNNSNCSPCTSPNVPSNCRHFRNGFCYK